MKGEYSKQSTNSFILPGFLVLLLVSLGIINTTMRFENSRPVQSDLIQDDYPFVRLWQDPLAAVAKDYQNRNNQITDAEKSRLYREFSQLLRDEKDQLILPVMIKGGPYSEEAEQRLRTRYAVLSALSTAGYSPESTQKLRYLIAENQSGPPKKNILIPYEVFIKDSVIETGNENSTVQKWKEIILIWINEDAVHDSPMDGITSLVRNFIPKEKLPGTIKIIGPTNSNTFINLVQVKKEQVKKETVKPPLLLQFCSPWVTLSETTLMHILSYSMKFKFDVHDKKRFDNSRENVIAIGYVKSPYRMEFHVPEIDQTVKSDTPYFAFHLKQGDSITLIPRFLPESEGNYPDEAFDITGDCIFFYDEPAPEGYEQEYKQIFSGSFHNADTIKDTLNQLQQIRKSAMGNWTILNAAEIKEASTMLLIAAERTLLPVDKHLPHSTTRTSVINGLTTSEMSGLLDRIRELRTTPSYWKTIDYAQQVIEKYKIPHLPLPVLIYNRFWKEFHKPVHILAEYANHSTTEVISALETIADGTASPVSDQSLHPSDLLPAIRSLLTPKIINEIHKISNPDILNSLEIIGAVGIPSAAEISEKTWSLIHAPLILNASSEPANFAKITTPFSHSIEYPVSYDKNRNLYTHIQSDVSIQLDNGNDEQLIEALLQELSYRLKPGNQNHLVLISELDTWYSRAFYRLFVDKIASNRKHHVISSPEHVHAVSYFKGIDGNIPTRQETNKPSQSQIEVIENPWNTSGQSQYDYLVRLVEDIRRKERQIKEAHGPQASFKAIGIMGTDVHDKLLILQALRQYFPEKVFFTTDLQAIYQQPENYEWTHNMIIASHFGLQLRGELQGSIPPFRDSYQTALYFTCLKILGVTRETEKKGTLDTATMVPKPRIYEVARGGFYEYPPNDGYPDQGMYHLSSLPILLVTLIAFLAYSIIHICYENDKQKKNRNKKNMYIAIAAGSLSLASMFIMYLVSYADRDGHFIYMLNTFFFIFIFCAVFLYPFYYWREYQGRHTLWFHMGILTVSMLFSVLMVFNELRKPSPEQDLYDPNLFFIEQNSYLTFTLSDANMFLYFAALLIVSALIVFREPKYRMLDYFYNLEDLKGLPARSARKLVKRCRLCALPFTLISAFFILLCGFFITSIIYSHNHPSGEPFFIFQGISAWPTIALRMLLLFVCLFAFVQIRYKLEDNELRIDQQIMRREQSFEQSLVLSNCTIGTFTLIFAILYVALIGFIIQFYVPGIGFASLVLPFLFIICIIFLLHVLSLACPKYVFAIPLFNQKSNILNKWLVRENFIQGNPIAAIKSGSNSFRYSIIAFWGGLSKYYEEDSRFYGLANVKSFEHLWSKYKYKSQMKYCWRHFVPRFMMFFSMGLILTHSLSDQFLPYRGEEIYMWHYISYGFVMVPLILIFYIICIAELCNRFIHLVRDTEPFTLRSDLPPDEQKRELLTSYWVKIQIIAKRTSVISNSLYFPYFALFILLLSRHQIIDDWTWSLPACVLMGLSILAVTLCVISMQFQARKTRSHILEQLDTKLVEAKMKGDETESSQIEFIIRKIQSINEGAFKPFFQNPVFNSIAIPLSGLGTVEIINILTKLTAQQ